MESFEARTAALTVQQGPDRGRVFPLHGGETTIGRSSAASIRLSDGRRLVSGMHARIRLHRGRFVLCDESRNGTWIRPGPRRDVLPVGRDPHELADGEVIVLTDGIELGFSEEAPARTQQGRWRRLGSLVPGVVRFVVLALFAWLLARLLK